MGELIRTMDWSESSLGNPDQWPQSLRTSVSICLNSRFPLLIWWGNDLVKIYNDAYREIISKKHPKAMGAKGADVWPEIWHIINPMLQGVLQNGEATWSEDQLLILERNGYPEECYFTYSYSAIRDETGKIGGVFCAVNETTKSVLKEKHLSKQFSNLFVQAPVAVCILRGENYIIEVINERMAEMWDRKLEDVIDKPAFDVLPELRDQGFKELLDTVYYKGERFIADELTINIRRNGQIENAYVKFIYEPLREENGTISGIMALAHEITEQVMARKKVEESEAFNRTVLESSPDCLKILDADGKLLFMNSNGLCSMEIDDFSMFQNQYWWNLWGSENQQMVKDAVNNALNGATATFQSLSPTAKGTLKWWDVIVSPVLDDGAGKVSRILAVSRDISEQKNAEEELKENENLFRTIANASTAALWMTDENINLTYINQTWINWTGRPFEEHMGEGWALSILPEDRQQVIQKVFEDFNARRNILVDFKIKRADGQLRWCVSEGAPRYLSNGNFAMILQSANKLNSEKRNI